MAKSGCRSGGSVQTPVLTGKVAGAYGLVMFAILFMLVALLFAIVNPWTVELETMATSMTYGMTYGNASTEPFDAAMGVAKNLWKYVLVLVSIGGVMGLWARSQRESRRR